MPAVTQAWIWAGVQLPPMHAPFTHVNPLEQAMPHPPQLFGSLVPFTHTPPHRIPGGAHVETQVLPAPQTAPALQVPPGQQAEPIWPQNEQAAPTHVPPNAWHS
jgi:hypothetical protein